MERIWIDSFDVHLKFALRNFKSAILLGTMIFALCFPVEAQQLKKIPLIGILDSGTRSASSGRIEEFREGLRQLGYVEGQNIAIDYRYADGKNDRLPELAVELARVKVDVFVAAGGNSTTRALQQATKTIPIVMTGGSDAVDGGLVSSLARPGGNITGLTSLWDDLSGKRLELLKETVPKLSRVAVLWSSVGGRLRSGKQAKPRRNSWVCSFIPWRYEVSTISRGHSKQQLRRVAARST